MSVSPLAVLSPRQRLDKSFCLLCQRKGGLVQSPSVGVLDRILTECKNIKEIFAGETGSSLLSKDYSYHSGCQKRSKLNKNYAENKRNKAGESFEGEYPSQDDIKPYTRSNKTPFDHLKCVICQEDKYEKLHAAHSDARSEQLQNALQVAPSSLADVLVRCEKARDAHAGDILYHTTCWETRIIRCKPGFGPVHEDNSFHLTEKLVLEDIRFAVETELLGGSVLEMKDLVQAFKSRMAFNNCTDDRTYSRQRIMIKNYLISAVPTIQFEDSVSNKSSQRIISKDLQNLALNLAIKASHDDNEFRVLRCAAKYLRDCASKHIKDSNIAFTGSVNEWNSSLPSMLTSFIRWILAGEVDLIGNRDSEVSQSACYIASNILYHFKTNRQTKYTPENPETSNFYKAHRSIHRIALGLAIHQFNRDKRLVKLISAPNFGVSVPYEEIIRWETRLANAVIAQITKNNNVYIPTNLKKNTLVQFHLDNIDFTEDTKDGRGTTHALNLVVFQQKIGPKEFPKLEVSQTSTSLTLNKNHFNELKYCKKPNKKEYSRNALCTMESPYHDFPQAETTTKWWLFVRSFEYLFSNNGKLICADIEDQRENDLISVSNIGKSYTFLDNERNLKYIAEDYEIPIDLTLDFVQPVLMDVFEHRNQFDENIDTDTFDRLRTQIMTSHDDLRQPSWSGMNSLIREKVSDLELTNVFNLPIIPGPASDYSAIYTALMIAHDVSIWTESESSKTINSLDLDLYEKIYLLINTRDDLRDSFLLCLGELHIVFGYIRAIGTFIECSGLDNAWVKSSWFGESTMRQVLDCSRMKRALECHEDTLIALTILYLQALLKTFPDVAMSSVTDLLELTTEMQKTVDEKDGGKLKKQLEHLNFHFISIKLRELMDKFDNQRKNNFEFQFLKIYMDMVSILLKFIYASRSRDWLLHLAALKEMMPAIIMMDRVKYRRMLSVYLTEMKKLEYNLPKIWDFFMNGNFSVQKNTIPFTAIGRDHAGEQENKKMKIAGGLKGISRSENARTRFFLIGPILKDIVSQMEELGGTKQRSLQSHHNLNPSFIKRQSARIIKLVGTFDTLQFSMDTLKDERLYNLITGMVFPTSSYKAVLSIVPDGKKLDELLLKERVLQNSTVSIFAPVKKTNTPVFKRSGIKKKARIENKVYQLQSHVNFFAQCAVVSNTRDIDMNEIIGKFELSSIASSFMQLDGELNNGGDGKSELVDIICKSVVNAKINAAQDKDNFDLVAIDAMQVLYKLTKTSYVKTFRDFANLFNAAITALTSSAYSVVVAFDTYLEESLKDAVRKQRVGKTVPVQYAVNDTFDIAKLSLKDILSHKNTKRDLSVYLMNSLHAHLKRLALQFVLAGNGKTVMSWTSEESPNNHEEADSLIIYTLSLALSNLQFRTLDTKVLVCSNDTDVFCLLVSHLENLTCKYLLMQWSQEEYIDISIISKSLGTSHCSALIGFHAFTGCDTVEKFTGISKERWTKLFLITEESILKALTNFQSNIDSSNWDCLEKFVCQGYLPKGCKIDSLEAARWHLFCNKTRNKKRSAKVSEANMMKLPPTSGSLLQHTRRALVQFQIWCQANKAVISEADPLQHGWLYEDDKYYAIATEDSIAPESVVISCNCKMNSCKSTNCSCKSFRFACTEICGCDDCENQDPLMDRNDEGSDSEGEKE